MAGSFAWPSRRRLVRVSPPTAVVVALDEMREHLRLDGAGSPATHPDDALISGFVKAATDEIDGRTGWLGRALIDQTWKLSLDRFPPGTGSCAPIMLPLTSALPAVAPLPDPVASIVYLATDGSQQTLDSSLYRVVFEDEPNFVEPVYSRSWPSTRRQAGAVAITYTAGYGDAADKVPELVRNYIKQRVGQLYEFREAVAAGMKPEPVPHVRDSLENFRLQGF